MESLQIKEKRKLLKQDPNSHIRSAVSAVNTKLLENEKDNDEQHRRVGGRTSESAKRIDFLKEAKKGNLLDTKSDR